MKLTIESAVLLTLWILVLAMLVHDALTEISRIAVPAMIALALVALIGIWIRRSWKHYQRRSANKEMRDHIRRQEREQ